MPTFSCFSPFGLFEFSSAPSEGAKYYRALVDAYTDPKTGLPIVDLSTGTYKEAWLYATAMALGRCKQVLKRARNQNGPETAFDLLRAWETSLGSSPTASMTLRDRQLQVGALYKIIRGFRFEAIEDAVRSRLGDDLLEICWDASTAKWPEEPTRGVPGIAVRAWRIVAATGSPTTIGFAFASPTTNDCQLLPTSEALGDYFALGHYLPFSRITINEAGGTKGVGGTLAWEYWNGAAWAALPGLVDTTNGFTSGLADGHAIDFTVPKDWTPTTITVADGAYPLYYVRGRVTGTYSTNPIIDNGRLNLVGPGLWVDTEVPAKVVRLLEPVVAGNVQPVKYEAWNSADPDPDISVGERLCVQPENAALAETVFVESIDGATTPKKFTARFAYEHDMGASATTGSVPFWSNEKCRALVVLKAAASADREKVRIVDEVFERHAPARTRWDVVRANSDSAPTATVPFAMQTGPLGETTIGAAVLSAYSVASEPGLRFWADPRDLGYGADGTITSVIYDKLALAGDFNRVAGGYATVAAGAIGWQRSFYFDGTVQMDSANPASSFFTTTAKTVYMVFRPTRVATDISSIVQNDDLFNDATNYVGIFLRNSQKIYSFNGSGGSAQSTFQSMTMVGARVMCFRHDGTNVYASLDGGPESSVASGATDSLAAVLRIGYGFSAARFRGYLGTILMANQSHAQSTRDRIFAYLRREWRLP